MGLVARVLEQGGIPTVTLSVNRAYSEKVRAPRCAYVRFPYGSVFGGPGDVERQREVLLATLRLLEDSEEPGTIVDLPFRWRKTPPERPSAGRERG